MAFDELVYARLQAARQAHFPFLKEKRMFGGVGFLVNGNMAFGVLNEAIMVRIPPEGYEAALAQPGARVMDFTGKVMRGWVVVDPPGFASEEALLGWLEQGVETAQRLPGK